MRQIDVEEFTTHPERYVEGGVAVQVRQAGRTIGYCLPALPASEEERRQAVADWGRTVEELRVATRTNRPSSSM